MSLEMNNLYDLLGQVVSGLDVGGLKETFAMMIK